MYFKGTQRNWRFDATDGAYYNDFHPRLNGKLIWWTTGPQPRRVTLAIRCVSFDGGRRK